jgi:flagellar M-ring protein FliF
VNLAQIFDRIKTLGASLTVAQRVSLAVTFVGVVALVSGSAYLMNNRDYVLLFSDLDAESAADVVGRLKTAKVPYQLADGGKSVRVPQSRADELRLDFASQGLPGSGRIGFEIFDKLSFGATEFVEQTNFRRALEGEIARTIATLSEVSSARVHIAIAKTSLFESREQPAKASVVLKLRGNRVLSVAAARGISSLVANAVEGLRPEAVVILDSHGRSLTKPSDEPDGASGVPSMERQLALERDKTTMLVALLEPVVGPGRVRVNVAVRLNANTEEQTEERWDPNTAVVRSRQTSADTTSAGSPAGGLAGVRGNQPDAAAAASPGKPPDIPAVISDPRIAGRSAETTNYEISHTTRRVVTPKGEIARLSVAVILDDQLELTTGKDGVITRKYKPREREELQKIQNLVSAAVGFDTTRGDQLTVENVAFDDRPVVDDVAKPTFWEQQAPHLPELGRIAGIVVLGLFAFLLVVRPVMKRALSAPPSAHILADVGRVAAALPGPGGAPRTIQDLEGTFEAELDAAETAKSDHRRVPVLTKRVASLTQTEPEQAARMIRAWITEDKRSG